MTPAAKALLELRRPADQVRDLEDTILEAQAQARRVGRGIPLLNEAQVSVILTQMGAAAAAGAGSGGRSSSGGAGSGGRSSSGGAGLADKRAQQLATVLTPEAAVRLARPENVRFAHSVEDDLLRQLADVANQGKRPGQLDEADLLDYVIKKHRPLTTEEAAIVRAREIRAEVTLRRDLADVLTPDAIACLARLSATRPASVCCLESELVQVPRGSKLGENEVAALVEKRGKKLADDDALAVLVFWKDGFTLDDGNLLRPYEDAASMVFLEGVDRGKMVSPPQEIYSRVVKADKSGFRISIRRIHRRLTALGPLRAAAEGRSAGAADREGSSASAAGAGTGVGEEESGMGAVVRQMMTPAAAVLFQGQPRGARQPLLKKIVDVLRRKLMEDMESAPDYYSGAAGLRIDEAEVMRAIEEERAEAAAAA